MERPKLTTPPRPVGALASLAIGFDRIAARPVLILPPLLLDLFLWLGPPLRITALFRQAADALGLAPGTDPGFAQQVEALKTALLALGERFNLFSALITLPVGVPSFMATRMPGVSPVAGLAGWSLADPLAVFLIWSALTLTGVTLGVFYHRWLAQQVAPQGQVAGPWGASARVLAWSVVLYGVLFFYSLAALVVASLVTQAWALLDEVVVFVAFAMLFWVAVYLMFTPHGIVRYRLGVLRAMLESALVVRWNPLGTVSFVGLALAISWLTGLVWNLPDAGSWFSALALVGHAFVSATLVAASYAFYQSRRDLLVMLRAAHEEQMRRRAEGKETRT